MRTITGCFILAFLILFPTPSFQQAGAFRYVNATDPTCQGHTPCYATIQAAVNAVLPGETVQIQAGVYPASLLIKGKNNTATATEASRILITADPAAPVGSVVLRGATQTTGSGDAVVFEASKFITLRGLTITAAPGRAILLTGGAKKPNDAIHLERNRLFGNGVSQCRSGVLVRAGNTNTVILNNLLYGNGRHGLRFSPGAGGEHVVVNNTIHSNNRDGVHIGKGPDVLLVNNLLTGNGVGALCATSDEDTEEGDPDEKNRPKGFGIRRQGTGQPTLIQLLANLICGNTSGELSGTLLDKTDANNQTPTGSEGPGVVSSPGCQIASKVYANVKGPDGLSNTADDDFTLAATSPGIDRGVDPRALGLPSGWNPLLEADFLSDGIRPQDGSHRGVAAFDIGALEKRPGGGGGGGCTPSATQACYTGPAGTAGVGICHAGTQTCGPDRTFGACVSQVLPGAEIPNNGIDENCDGHDAQCNPGATASCYSGPSGTAGVGICKAGTQTCGADGLFGSCIGEVLPTTEIPNNSLDEDCNGSDLVTGGGGLPPDPATVAPPVARSIATTIGAATAFLYTGANPIQTGVAAGTIDPTRAAVFRGKVLDRANAPLPGVTISILNHPEFGQTLSRADGMFDLAVNGGGLLTLNYQKAGLLPAQRQVNTPSQDYASVPDVMLIPLDPQVTTIDLTANVPVQVAQGGRTTDADGTRQATLLFPQGTQAQMVMPDGSTQSITMLHVRATEYTVGPDGPKMMPGDLPPTSLYTYAVELNVDEALAAGATSVQFNQPVPFYVENFRGFPTGVIVPVGFYDRTRGLWVPSENGLVIKVLSITNGLVDLDLDGNGTADSPTELATLGITDAERQRLAALYLPGQTLWRVPVRHFSPIDCNWPGSPPDGSCSPSGICLNAPPPSGPPPGPQPDQLEDNPCQQNGSIVECQNQTLGEEVSVTGTPFRLHYQSDRVPGRQSAYTLPIRLTGSTLPAGLQGIELELRVAGRLFTQHFAPVPNLFTTFTWDGKDAYGRTMQGAQPATVRIGYDYLEVYYGVADRFARNALFGLANGLTFNQEGSGVICCFRLDVAAPALSRIFSEWQTSLGTWDMRSLGLGGWALSILHPYDPAGRVLYKGSGGRRSVNSPGLSVLTTVAGGDVPPCFSAPCGGDGGPATQAQLVAPSYVAIGPDGSLYITDIRAGYIRRVGSDGVITTVVGNHECFTPTGCGDGGPALQAGIGNITSLAVGSDGSLYFIDVNRVRRVDPNGIITAFAGTGDYGFSGDGGPAITATFATAVGLAAAPDGSLYIGDPNNRRVRRVGPDGIITTFAGTGEPCTALLMLPDPCGDNGPAVQAKLTGPSSLAIGPDGSLYIADLSLRSVRRVSPNGIISTVAGTRNTGFSGDGGLATSALFSEIRGITVGRDGSLIIADSSPNLRVRYVGPDGMVKTIAGTGRSTGLFGGDNAPATQTNITAPFGVAVGLDGIVYFAEPNVNRIRRIGFNLPGFSVNDFSLASEDGSELYQFNSAGLHLRTLNALTGVLRYQFTYDGGNRLTTITDGDGNVTTIERNGSGDATAIIGPFSQRTALSLDSNGYLASIANPAGEVFRMAYTSDGLLTQFTDPRGNVSRVTYDPQGRLLQDTDAAGGFHHLARTDDDTTSTVTRTTALGRTTTYQVTKLPTGDKQQVVTFPDGAKNQLVSQTNATRTLTVRNGTVSTSQQGPDPRFGMQVPVLTSWTLTTPGRLTWNTTDTRTVSLSDPSNQLSLATQTDVVKLNNHTYTCTYDAASRTFTLTTPAGRQHTATIDLQGRPLRVAVPGLNPLQFAYDSRGRLISLTQDNRTYTFAYDSHSFLSLLTDPLTHTLSFIRDAVGRTTDITQPDGNHVLFTYDANGNMVSLTPPGRSTHTFGFTAVDLLQNYEPPTVPGNPTGAQLVYNLDRQLTQLVRAGTSINLSYDGAGRLLSISYPQDTVSGTYDAAGRLQTLTTASGSGLTYGYDGGVLLDTTWSGPVTGTIHRTIDNNFRLTSRTINGGNSQSFVYDDDGLLTQAGALVLQRSAQNGLVTGATLGVVRDTRSFNSFGEWTDYSATVGATMLFSTQYTRDLLGRITEQVETIESSTTTFTYTYDDVGRLIEVKHNGVATAAYTYDANGNRLRRTAGGAVDGVYDAQDRLTLYGATTYTYAASGELLSKTTGGQTTAYSYDVLGNLRGVTLPGGAQIQYLIDGRNRRTGKKVNGATVQGFLYQDRLRPIAELDGHNAVVSTFVYGSRANVPEYLVKGGTTYRIRTDHLGSPRLVVDTSTGAIVQRLDYDEFGNVLADTNPGFQPFGFAGGLYDQDTKLVRFGARDYDPETGRWTSKDVVGLARGLNLYVYANNDPVNFIDRTGKNPGAAAAGAAGVVGSAAAGGGAATTTGTVFGLGATSAFIARAGILGVPVAVGILIAAYLEDSAIEHADSIDDEGPNEGGAPDTVPDPTAPDSGVCGGPILPPALPENERPTIPVPQIIDPHDPAVPVDPEGPTIRPPKEDRPTEEPPYPGGPLIPDIPGPPKLPTF